MHYSVTLKMIKRLKTFIAGIKSLAGSAAECTHQMRVAAATPGAKHYCIFQQSRIHAFTHRWRYAVLPQFFFGSIRHPISCPSW